MCPSCQDRPGLASDEATSFRPGADLTKVLRAAGLVTFVQVASSALAYFSQVLLARWLGVFEFGVYVFAWNWAVLLPIVTSLGLEPAAVRFVPQYLVQEEWGRLRGFLRRGSAFVLVGGVLVAAAGWLALAILGARVPGYSVVPVRLALLCVPLLGLISFMAEASRGFGRVALAYIPQRLVLPGLFIVAVAVISTTRAPDAVLVLKISVVVCVVTALAMAVLFRRVLVTRVRAATPEFHTRGWLRVALPLFLTDGLFAVLLRFDTVMLGAMRSPDEVAVYAACLRTAGLAVFVFTAMSALVAPKFAELYAQGNRAAQVDFVRSVARWTFWPSAVVAVGLAVFGRPILAVFGPSFAAGYPSLLILTAGLLTFTITGPTNAYLAASGHQDDIVPAIASAIVTNITMNAFLIPRYGVMGAAVASAVGMVVGRVLLYVAVRRRLGLETLFLR